MDKKLEVVDILYISIYKNWKPYLNISIVGFLNNQRRNLEINGEKWCYQNYGILDILSVGLLL